MAGGVGILLRVCCLVDDHDLHSQVARVSYRGYRLPDSSTSHVARRVCAMLTYRDLDGSGAPKLMSVLCQLFPGYASGLRPAKGLFEAIAKVHSSRHTFSSALRQ